MHPRTIHHPNIPQCCGNLHSEVVLKPIGNKTLPFFAFKWVPSQAKSDTFENTTTAAITLTPHQEIRYEAIVTIRILKPVFPIHVDVCNLNFFTTTTFFLDLILTVCCLGVCQLPMSPQLIMGKKNQPVLMQEQNFKR